MKKKLPLFNAVMIRANGTTLTYNSNVSAVLFQMMARAAHFAKDWNEPRFVKFFIGETYDDHGTLKMELHEYTENEVYELFDDYKEKGVVT